MKFSCICTAVVPRKSHRWRFEATHLCFSTVMRSKRGFCCKWGRAFCSWWVWWSFPPLTLMIGCLVPEHQAFLSVLPRAAGKMRGDKEWGHFLDYAGPSYWIFWSHRRELTWVLHTYSTYSAVEQEIALFVQSSVPGHCTTIIIETTFRQSNVET